MSIIQEALKKAQSDHVKTEEPAAPVKEDAAPTPIFAKRALHIGAAAQSRAKSIPLALMIMLAFAAVVFTANHFFMSRPGGSAHKTTDTAVKTAPAFRQEVAYKDTEKKADADDTPAFALNGIMYLETGPKAIIDGNVVEEGDLIKGATVKTINRNSVILNYKDREISLNLKD